MTALIDDGLTDMQRTIARQQQRRQAWANPQPFDYAGAIDEHRQRKAAADAAPKVEEPIGLSAGCVAAGMRFHARIGRLGDSKRLQRHYERATREVGAKAEPKKDEKMPAEIIPYQPHSVRVPAAPVWRGVVPTGMDDSLRMAKVIVASGMAPRSLFTDGVDPVAAVWTVLQLGAEVGLSPMASVQNICLINGRPGLFGPAMLAVVEASGLLESIEEGIEGTGDTRYAFCTVKRVGRASRTSRFGVIDAQRAGLWDKRGRNGAPGPWQQYPDRMLQARARTFALRDVFPDVLMGLSASVEELQDIPAEEPEPPKADAARPVLPPVPEAVEPPKAPATDDRPLYVNLPGGGRQEFKRTKGGMKQALDFMEREVAPLVMNNLPLLDLAAETFPDLADRIAELRAAAAQALTPASDDDPVDVFPGDEERIEEAFASGGYDSETGEVLDKPDPIAQMVAVRRGAAPADTEDSMLR